jgi:ABC-type multidrug transport system fused ATPase/permease subunit
LQSSGKIFQNWTWNDSASDILSAIKNNLSFGIEQFIEQVGPSSSLLYLGAFLIIMTAFKVGSAYLGAYFLIPIRTGVLRDLRNQLYRKIISLPIGFFTEERKGDIMARMTGDVNEVDASIMSSLEMVFKNPIMILIYLGVMFAMSWELTLFVLLLLPFSGWLIGRIGRSLRRSSTTGQQQTGDLLSQIEETLGGLRVVKAFNAEHKLEARFSILNEKIKRTFTRINRRFNLAHPVSELIGTMVIAILLWFGGVLILGNKSSINAAEFIYYLVIFYSIIQPSKDLSRASYSIQKGLASL